MPVEGRFAGRGVVITGGAGGIGRALCDRFLAEGARVALLDCRGAEAAAAEYRERGQPVWGVPCDVTDPEGCREAIAEAARRLESIDVLINNAGAVHRSAFADTRPEVFAKVMDVNLHGAIHVTQAALPRLRSSRGLIIVTSSIAGVAPLYGRSGYAASKHALHGLFESARAELAADGIGILMVCPSFTRTPFEQAALGADGRPVGRGRSSVGKTSSPEEVAAAVVRAAARRRRILVLSNVGKISYVLSRLAPSLYERLMVRSLSSELA